MRYKLISIHTSMYAYCTRERMLHGHIVYCELLSIKYIYCWCSKWVIYKSFRRMYIAHRTQNRMYRRIFVLQIKEKKRALIPLSSFISNWESKHWKIYDAIHYYHFRFAYCVWAMRTDLLLGRFQLQIKLFISLNWVRRTSYSIMDFNWLEYLFFD